MCPGGRGGAGLVVTLLPVSGGGWQRCLAGSHLALAQRAALGALALAPANHVVVLFSALAVRHFMVVCCERWGAGFYIFL